MGGKYQWKVIALDSNGFEICTAESFIFEKPEYNPPAQNNGGDGGNDGGGDNTSTSSDWSDWSTQ
jgi:hypothetical protein